MKLTSPETFKNIKFDSNIKNTGKSIKMDYPLGLIYFKGVKYTGYEIVFHVPSEHTIGIIDIYIYLIR